MVFLWNFVDEAPAWVAIKLALKEILHASIMLRAKFIFTCHVMITRSINEKYFKFLYQGKLNNYVGICTDRKWTKEKK